MSTLDKQFVIEVLIDAASNAANESTATHPEDIEIAMTSAMRSAASTLNQLAKAGYLATKAFETEVKETKRTSIEGWQ